MNDAIRKKRIDPIRFVESACRTEYGGLVTLEWWQVLFYYIPIYYTFKIASEDNDVRGVKKGDRLRRYNQVLIGVPKKMGKSDTGAYSSAIEMKAGSFPSVIGMAGDKEQARIVYSRTKNMVEASEELSEDLECYKNVMERKDGFGSYTVMACDAGSSHGFNPSLKVWDEYWQYTNYDMVEAVSDSPSRAEPLEIIITYAGTQKIEGIPLWDLYCKGNESGNKEIILNENGQWSEKVQEEYDRLRLSSWGKKERLPARMKEGPEYAGWEPGDIVWRCVPEEQPGTYLFWSEVNLARWIDEGYLQSQKGKLPRSMYRRMHKNKWPGSAEGFVTEEQMVACEQLYEQLYCG